MQRQTNFIRIVFLTFIIGGLFFSFVFAQEKATQMLDLLEGKDIGGFEGDELDFLLDELAEDNGFLPLGPRQAEVLSDNQKLVGLEEEVQVLRDALKNNWGSTGEVSLEAVRRTKKDLLILQKEIERLYKKNLSLEGEIGTFEGTLSKRFWKHKKELQSKEEGSLEDTRELKDELFSLKRELGKVNQKNSSLKKDVKHLRRKLARRRQHLSKEAAAQRYEELGTAYTQAKVYKQAIEAYTTALKLDPRSSKAHHDLGLLYEHFLGDSSKAVYHLNQYLKLDPDPKDRERVAHLIRIIKKEDIRDRVMR